MRSSAFGSWRMTLHVALHHRTTYHYDRLVALGPQILRLRPAPYGKTPILSYSLAVEPKRHFINWQQDPHANYQARLVFPERTRELIITVDLVADLAVTNPFDFFLEPAAETFPFRYDPDLAAELAPYCEVEPAGPRLRQWLAAVDRGARRTIDFLVDLNLRLQRDIGYVIRMEPGVQTPEETLGLAARFVSGYLIQLKPDVKPLTGPEGPASDFTDLHAWAEVYLPGAGWVGLDPTSGLFAGEGHIPLAATPAPPSAAAITGAVETCEVTFDHAMSVTRLRESARVTKPYTEEQWQRIDRLGRLVDHAIEGAGIKLTMGGEPTFVAVDDRDGAEWNTEAVGPNKRRLGLNLLKQLKEKYAANGLIHLGQGKWYPGEPLPRWSLSCFWRKDGEPVWNDAALFADESVDC